MARGGSGEGKRAPGGALALAAGLGLAGALWAAFQWVELVIARRGGEVLCAPGGGGHCAEVWDSPFASAVHALTGLPVAAWGVAFGAVAFALPFLARRRAARGAASDAFVAATWLTAAAGALGSSVLLYASLRFGHICTTCALSYALAGAYAVVVFGLTRAPALAAYGPGAGFAASGVALAFLVLIVPGLRTPRSAAEQATRALGEPAGAGVPSDDDHELARFIAGLPPQAQQLLSDTLAAYAGTPEVELLPARSTVGTAAAPRLRFTEFSDTLCAHCAQFHKTLEDLRVRFGADAFTLAPHQYPLDPSCNPSIKRDEPAPLTCMAARAQICAEGRPGAFEVTGELFRRQRELDEPRVLELVSRVLPREELVACIAAPETEQKLAADIAWAVAHGIQGTPLLYIGRRQVIPYPPLIYALALTRGAAAHPAFIMLPPPMPLPLPGAN